MAVQMYSSHHFLMVCLVMPFLLTILIGLIGVVLYIDFLGLIMVVIYALSIVVVASHLKMFSLLSNQVMQTLDNVDNAFDQLIHKSLEKVSYTLTSIGNFIIHCSRGAIKHNSNCDRACNFSA